MGASRDVWLRSAVASFARKGASVAQSAASVAWTARLGRRLERMEMATWGSVEQGRVGHLRRQADDEMPDERISIQT